MLIAICTGLAGYMLYSLVKPPSPAPQPESAMPQEVDVPVSYSYEANPDA
ncbi:MAG: hypothetical protein IRY98_12010 [Alicyclobacillaceae bacterium]|nr:hypothetical protein [Alicyclobacillaceae bacterium]